MSKHTPGRWVLTDTHRVVSEDGSLLATAWFPRRLPDADEDRLPCESWLAARERLSPIREQVENELKANARLIAAAPDLLEALRWYVDNDDVAVMPGNDFWLDGKARAIAAIAKATGEQP